MLSKNIENSKNKNYSFPIVGIGTSAGGLEALELFLRNVPKKSGMAFIIIQHMDPTHKGMLVELLSRVTTMPVIQIKDRTIVQPDYVYIIPPNKDLSIFNGILHLFTPEESRGFRLPIDYFFRSIANDQKEKSIGVILSGMGTDGTLGLKAIKETGGMVFVQNPNSAKFDGMPKSAIDSGLPLAVAPVEALPGKIISYLRHLPVIKKDDDFFENEKNQSALEKIFILLREKTGNDFLPYKKTTIYRRIERRMSIHQIDKINTYVNFLLQNPQEVELLFKELLVGVTSFFRDSLVWEEIKKDVLLELLTKKDSDGPIRAWVPGCSTGEEAYSLAIAFKETIENFNNVKNISLQIFATDLDCDAINKAREGVFPANIEADVTQKRLNYYFSKVDRGYQINKSIRGMVIFAPQNIIKDPPFTKVDLLCCRNLLIYIGQEMQKKLIPLFYYSLRPEGFLLLGNAETIGSFNNLFVPLNRKFRIYKKIKNDTFVEPIEYPLSFYPSTVNKKEPQVELKSFVNIQTLTKELLMEEYCPAAVLVNNKGDILFISGHTGKYLEPAAGKANWNIFAMVQEGIKYELTGAFAKAIQQKNKIVLNNITIRTDNDIQEIELTIHPLKKPEEMQGMIIIVFKDIKKIPELLKSEAAVIKTSASHIKIAELEKELDQTKYKLQTIHEEMQAYNEELQSANEELQSANEELQSTNEELTTSKEESQSMNEELQTLNNELQQKIDQLLTLESDMKNLLESTHIAILFLDENLNVRRFTSQTANIIKLIPTDIGRPVTDIATSLIHPEFVEDVQQVLKTLARIEKQVETKDGCWFNISIMPYRTLENKIDGVVITFSDITALKRLEEKSEKAGRSDK